MDFMVDQLFDGRKLRVLTIVDICTKLCPATLVMYRARQGRRWQGRRTQMHLAVLQGRGRSHAVSSGRRGRDERWWTVHCRTTSIVPPLLIRCASC